MEPRATMNSSRPALEDAVHDSQRLFRQVLGALSEPGTLHELRAPEPPEPRVGGALWGALLSLGDLETTIWIAADLDSPALRDALAFLTGARTTDEPASADFALITPASFDASLAFRLGSDSYPDRSTTLLVAVERLDDRGPWQLSGPGIETRRAFGIGGGDDAGCEALMARLAANCTTFPRGLDALFGCGSRLAAIPRSTRVTRADSQETN